MNAVLGGGFLEGARQGQARLAMRVLYHLSVLTALYVPSF